MSIETLVVTRERGYSNFECTHSATELNQKLTKKHAQKTLATRHLQRPMQEVKEGEGCLLEGDVFSGAYGTYQSHSFCIEFSLIFV